jgi:hypothetical protein
MRRLLSSLVLLFSSACSIDNPVEDPPALDFAMFRCDVQPVLVKQCSAPACHGTPLRYYRLFARNRLRYGIDPLDRADPLSEFEVMANYDATRALVSGLDTPNDSMLVRKPLEPEAGGYYHGATETFLRRPGYNVFTSVSDEEYQVIARWAAGAVADPNCVDPGAAP